MALKDRLIHARSALGWTQSQLAEASAVAAAQISRYEAARSVPRPEVIAKLAKALNVQFDWLVNGAGPVEGDDPDRPLPSGNTTLSLDVSEETSLLLQRYAMEQGLTLEMAARKLIFEAMRLKLDQELSEPKSSSSEHLKMVKDLSARVEKLERGSKR